MTIQQLYDYTWRNYWNQDRFRASRHAREVEKLYTRHIKPTLGKLPCAAVGPLMVRKWHTSMAETPVTANRSKEVLSRMFRFAEEHELRKMGTNPCSLVKAYPEPERVRYASEEEIRAIGEVLTRYLPYRPREVAIVYLLALTGSRPIALAKIRRDEYRIEPDGTGLMVFDGKTTAATGQREVLVLSPDAVRIVERLPRRRDGLLIGPFDIRRFWNDVRVEAKCPDMWLRDWRRTFGTVALSHGVPLDVLGELLNHKSKDTTAIYAKLLPTARRDASTLVSNKMAQLLNTH